MQELSIDLETFSHESIQTAGAPKYMASPMFEIILFAWAFDDEPVQCVDDMTKIPKKVMNALTDPNIIKTAYNAAFEIGAIETHFNIVLDPKQWRCTMVKAMMLGLPGGLDAVGKVLQLDTLKDKEGLALIKFFCCPCRPTKANGGRWRNYPWHDPEKWKAFIKYCVQDVVVERKVKAVLAWFKIQPIEHDIWVLDQKINKRGVKVDMVLVNAAIQLNNEHKRLTTAKVCAMTGLDKASIPKLKEWLTEVTDLEITSLDKDNVPLLIDQLPDGIPRDVLRMRQELGKASVAKFDAMLRQANDEDVIQALVQYYGAGRTGRWAGRGVQVHNLPRQEEDDFGKGLHMLDSAREWAKAGNMESLDLLWGNIPKTLSQLIRTALVPRDGNVFLPADFSAIEARVTAWLAGESWRMDVFNTHGKIYEASASQMFKVALELVTKGSPLRQQGKIAELALGFGGGPGALVRMGALDMDFMKDFMTQCWVNFQKLTGGKASYITTVDGEEREVFFNEYKDHKVMKELAKLVKVWRNANRKIVTYWEEVEDCMVEAVANPGTNVTHKHGVSFRVERNVLFITLPSGRRLAYQEPRLVPGKYEGTWQVTYMVWQKKFWSRTSTYGGKITENIVQAIARDLLAYSMLRLDKHGFDIALHVHDEAVPEVPAKFAEASIPVVNKLMSQQPTWAVGLPLKAESYIATYYRKD